MGFGAYFSAPDIHEPGYRDLTRPLSETFLGQPERAEWAGFLDLMEAQVTEVCTEYGELFSWWWDIGFGDQWPVERFHELVRRLQPGCLINDRLGGLAAGVAPELAADFLTPEQSIPRAIPRRSTLHQIDPVSLFAIIQRDDWEAVVDQIAPVVQASLSAPADPSLPADDDVLAWEACHTFGGQWAWAPELPTCKTGAEIITSLVEVASRGGNLLMNVGPRPDGTVQAEFQTALREVGDWLSDHGDGIYGTTFGPVQGQDGVRSTATADHLYLHLVGDAAEPRRAGARGRAHHGRPRPRPGRAGHAVGRRRGPRGRPRAGTSPPGRDDRRAGSPAGMAVITDLVVHDVRFPTSEFLDGSDAMNPDPDYSAAYAELRTDDPDLTGWGMTFTIGRGNEVCGAAIEAFRSHVVGRRPRRPRGRSRLHLPGPDRRQPDALAGPREGCGPPGHRSAGQRAVGPAVPPGRPAPLEVPRRPLARAGGAGRRLPPHLRRALARRRPSTSCEAQAATKPEREVALLADGYPAYITSAGWLGYDDDKIRARCQEAIADGWTALKMKVGRDLADDLRRARLIRSEIGPDRRLMLDANQVWDVDEAITNVQALAAVDPWWIEEPTSPDDILGHAADPRRSRAGPRRHRRALPEPGGVQAAVPGRRRSTSASSTAAGSAA